MERATQDLVTKGGHKVKLITYFTAGETQDIARLVPENATTDQQIDANNKGVVKAIVSLDESAENIEARLLELPIQDFREISDLVQTLVEDKKK